MLDFLTSGVGPVVLIVIVALVLIMALVLSTWRKIPNDHAAVIVGAGKPKVVTGGGTMVIPLLQRMDMITLETLGLAVSVTGVKTSLGVPINADGYVIIKVKGDEQSILTAMQMFYCSNEQKTKDKIMSQTQKLCEGKLREIVSGMTVEEIYDDREKFSSQVMDVASTALNSLGLELKSFTINDISDDDEYIESLGKAQIAKVKADAEIAQAEARKEESIKTAEANRLGEQARIAAETQVAEAEKQKQLKLFEFQQEQETKKAEADSAYQIQQNITSKQVTDTEMDARVLMQQRSREVREAEIQVEIAAEQKSIELAEKQAARKEAELLGTMIKPAEAKKAEEAIKAEAEKIARIRQAEAESEAAKLAAQAAAEAKKMDAEAEAETIKKRGEAEAEAIRSKGTAEAEAIRQKGLAEAEALEKKAEALAKMNEAGKLQMVMDILPEFARAVSEPMSRIGNVTVIGGGDDAGISAMTGSTVSALKAVTDAVKSTTGFDLTRVMEAQTIDAKTERNVHLDGATLQVEVVEAPNNTAKDNRNPSVDKAKHAETDKEAEN